MKYVIGKEMLTSVAKNQDFHEMLQNNHTSTFPKHVGIKNSRLQCLTFLGHILP